jgi:cytochrome P450
MAGDATIAGHELKAGETVLVALAAANRDPFANPDPDRFNLFRANRQMFSFGVDRHACPGHSLAGLIAKVALAELFKAGLVPERLAGPVAYRPSVNARIPIL